MSTPQKFDVLDHFFMWWMQGVRGGIPPSIHEGVTRVGPYTGLILFRQPPFQVQLWILEPNVESPEHSHDNVDTFLVHVTGEIRLWQDGKLVLSPEQTVADENGRCKVNGNYIRLFPGQKHKAASGPLGGAFMVVQHWLDGKPRSTELDWGGEPINDEHEKKIAALSARYFPVNSNCFTREADSISKKEPDTVRLPVDFKSKFSTRLGARSSAAGAARCGPASETDESPGPSQP